MVELESDSLLAQCLCLSGSVASLAGDSFKRLSCLCLTRTGEVMGPEEMRFEEMRFSRKVHAERRKKNRGYLFSGKRFHSSDNSSDHLTDILEPKGERWAEPHLDEHS